MTLNVTVAINEGIAHISLDGRFDFNSQRAFRSSYDGPLNDHEIHSIEVDMKAVDYLDSSALGMLLLLKERVEAANKSLVLANCRGTVKQVLDVANFHKLFTIR
ncbi:MAG TPA: anti-anti-sigma factor [Betaproteobacteria bacterium]|nr:anti-anti-sigma factor [Betaproteobacteria bacterium]